MKQLNLKIITPEKVVIEEMVDQVTIPTTEGEITILPGHVPLVSLLGKGDIVAKTSGEDVPFIAIGGFVRVNDNEVAIMADFAEHVSNIATESAIEDARNKANDLQKKFENNEIVDAEHFEAELERSLMRARIGDKWKIKKYRK